MFEGVRCLKQETINTIFAPTNNENERVSSQITANKRRYTTTLKVLRLFDLVRIVKYMLSHFVICCCLGYNSQC